MRSPLFLAVSLAMAAAFQLSGPAAAAPADGPASAGPIALGDFMGRKRGITVNVAGQQGRFLLDTGGGVTVRPQLGRQRALVVLLTPLEPSAVEEGLLPVLPVLGTHHRVVLASVRDPELARLAAARDGLDQVYAAAAAEQTLSRRRATADLLAALGVHVVDVPADDLPPALADHYLALKARGLL